MKLFILCMAVLIAQQAAAQTEAPAVAVFKDPRVAMLVKKQAQINEESVRMSRRTMPGFRIQVVNTTERKVAIDAKSKIYQMYPELQAYLLYQAPYYRLRIGNFKTKQEAEDYQNDLSKVFPGAVFIVRDVIEVKPEPAVETQ